MVGLNATRLPKKFFEGAVMGSVETRSHFMWLLWAEVKNEQGERN